MQRTKNNPIFLSSSFPSLFPLISIHPQISYNLSSIYFFLSSLNSSLSPPPYTPGRDLGIGACLGSLTPSGIFSGFGTNNDPGTFVLLLILLSFIISYVCFHYYHLLICQYAIISIILPSVIDFVISFLLNSATPRHTFFMHSYTKHNPPFPIPSLTSSSPSSMPTESQTSIPT